MRITETVDALGFSFVTEVLLEGENHDRMHLLRYSPAGHYPAAR
jgi:hypothetical protein